MHSFVITLIAHPINGNLTANHISSVTKQLNTLGGTCDEPVWLGENEACDIIYYSTGSNNLHETVAKALLNEKVDYVVQPIEHRRKKMLISDMDSTIINQECVDELADVLGIKAKVSEITERAMNGELDFKEALVERVALLEGLNAPQLQEVFDSKISLMSGARTLVQTMKAHGAVTILVSGGFTFFTDRVADITGFDHHEANQLEIAQDKLTGKVTPPILDKEAKKTFLASYAAQNTIEPVDVLAVGDGANDLPMLKEAGLGVAYHAKPAVKAEVQAHIEYGDLTALLYAQGYKKEEFLQ